MQFKANNLAEKIRTSVSMRQELRTIGQALESLDVEDFDLKAEGEGYFALATAKTGEARAGVKNALKSAWRNVTGRDSSDSKLTENAPGVLRVLFTPEGLLRLEHAGKAKRRSDSAGVPNLKKLAQVLRMVGERLDTKSGRLLKVSKRGDRIAFEYATASNGCHTEEWKLSELYVLWLKASKQRQEWIDILERKLDAKPVRSK
jgi:hypothetical protein